MDTFSRTLFGLLVISDAAAKYVLLPERASSMGFGNPWTTSRANGLLKR